MTCKAIILCHLYESFHKWNSNLNIDHFLVHILLINSPCRHIQKALDIYKKATDWHVYVCKQPYTKSQMEPIINGRCHVVTVQ